MAKIHTLVVGQLHTNCYIVQSETNAIVVDPGAEPERILRFVKDIGVTPSRIIATHCHFDHVLGVEKVKSSLKIPFQIHKNDLPILQSMQTRTLRFMGFEVPPPPKTDSYINEGEILRLGTEKVQVLHTPGHSPGSVSLYCEGFVLSGDALFNQSIGRTDLPGGDLNTLLDSIREKLFTLDDSTVVYPGHGPETSIGDEKLANPFVGAISKRLQ